MSPSTAWLAPITVVPAILLALVGCMASDDRGLPGSLPASPVATSQRPTPTPTPNPAAMPTATAQPTVILMAAGDIAHCDVETDSAVGALIAEEDDATVAALGDLVYPVGSEEAYDECYDEAWGSFLDRTRPAPGNHDVSEDGGAAYFSHFGERAGTPGEGWYSYDIGAWHVVVLNSNCRIVDCEAGSPQHEWLVADLATSDAACTLAYWHHARFASGQHGDDPRTDPFWAALHEADADLVLVGHDHHYERFAALDPDGSADPAGIRQFVVGTGGRSLRTAVRVAPGSELIIDDAFGALRLTLEPGGYAWSFITVDGIEADSGAADCR